MKRRFTYVTLILLGGLLFGTSARAQVVITSVNTWTRTVDEGDLTTPDEAGSDINTTVETPSNFNQLDIRNVPKTRDWKIAVSRSDVNWPAAFTISVKRTSLGTPCAGCAGVNPGTSPTSYVPVTAMETDLIFGTGEVNGINLQFKIDGLSLLIDADYYSTEIIYTLYGD